MNRRPFGSGSRLGLLVLAILTPLLLTMCAGEPADRDTLPLPTEARGDWAVCGRTVPGPAQPPAGAVVIDPAVVGDLSDNTEANPPDTTFWLAPGTHTLTGDEFAQVIPKNGDTYLGAPGAILDGQGVNRYAFTQHAEDVTIRHLTIQGFVAPRNESVVNHDSGNGWLIEYNTIQNNDGAALMAGSHQEVRDNCLRNNGQYGMNAYQAGDDIVDLLVVGNEIVGNNTDNWEERVPGCGCTGGIKFWSVDGADIRGNWIHDNHGPGLWADTNNNDFIVEHNLIARNGGPALFYETSYNLIVRNNIIRGNAIEKGTEYAAEGDTFPVAAMYISESGGEPLAPARTDQIEIYNNVLQNNWSGITLWENADRFCNSLANTSSGYCTLLVQDTSVCSQPGIAVEPLYSDCRWKTQRVDIHDNTFIFEPAVVGCFEGFAGRMGILSNYGTYPNWSPYKGTVVQEAITFAQGNRWHDNRYVGPWMFVPFDPSRLADTAQWQAEPYDQDVGSTFTGARRDGGC